MKYAGALILVIFLICPGVVICEDEIPSIPYGPIDPQPPGNTWFKPNEPVSLNFDRTRKIKYVKVKWNDVNGDEDLGSTGALVVDNQNLGWKTVGEKQLVWGQEHIQMHGPIKKNKQDVENPVKKAASQ